MKQVYKIPSSLDKSYLDTEVAVQASNGMGLRPLPLKTILLWIASIFVAFLMIFSTSFTIHYLPLPLRILFSISLLAAVFILSSKDPGGQTRFSAMRNMATYMFIRKSRLLRTRNTDAANDFYRLVGIKKIDKRSGMVEFTDNTYGYFYRVVGNASALLFDGDKTVIIDRVDNFYRKFPDWLRVEYITVKEPQKVIRQKANLKQLFRGLDNSDKDIHYIMHEYYRVLDEFVGHEFKSMHQYMLITANSKEYCNKGASIIQNEADNSRLMFKEIEPLYYDDVEHFLWTVYSSGKEVVLENGVSKEK